MFTIDPSDEKHEYQVQDHCDLQGCGGHTPAVEIVTDG
jgi:hypothetical protein